MSAVVFSTVCLIVLSLSVAGVTGFLLGYQTGRDRERVRKGERSYEKLADTVVQLAQITPRGAPAAQAKEGPRTPDIVERPVRSGIFLGDDPGPQYDDDEVMPVSRRRESGVAASIPMNN